MKVELNNNTLSFTLDDPQEVKSLQWIVKRYGVDHFSIFMRDFLSRKLEERRLDSMEQVKQLLYDDDVITLLKSKGVDL